MHICIYICYVDSRSVVEITTVSVGCGYVNISWNVTGNNDMCSVFSYNVTLSYVTMDDHVTKSVITTMNSYTFTGLPDDTQVNITVFGVHRDSDILSIDSTSVRTIDIKSMCQFIIKSCWLHY